MADPILPHARIAIYFCESCGANWPHMGSRKASQRATLHNEAGHVVYVTEADPETLTVTGVNRRKEPVTRDDVRNYLADQAEKVEPVYFCKTCGWSIAQDMSEQSYNDQLDHQGLGHIVIVTEKDIRELRVTAEQRSGADLRQVQDAIIRIRNGEENVAVSVEKDPELIVRAPGKVVSHRAPVGMTQTREQDEEAIAK